MKRKLSKEALEYFRLAEHDLDFAIQLAVQDLMIYEQEEEYEICAEIKKIIDEFEHLSDY